MELVKDTPARFEHSDLVLLVKTKASVGDKMAVEQLLANIRNARTIDNLPKTGKELVRLFVVGWEGVTQDGKPVPFQYDLLYSGLPAALADTLMPALYKFIQANVDILTKPTP